MKKTVWAAIIGNLELLREGGKFENDQTPNGGLHDVGAYDVYI